MSGSILSATRSVDFSNAGEWMNFYFGFCGWKCNLWKRGWSNRFTPWLKQCNTHQEGKRLTNHLNIRFFFTSRQFVRKLFTRFIQTELHQNSPVYQGQFLNFRNRRKKYLAVKFLTVCRVYWVFNFTWHFADYFSRNVLTYESWMKKVRSLRCHLMNRQPGNQPPQCVFTI